MLAGRDFLFGNIARLDAECWCAGSSQLLFQSLALSSQASFNPVDVANRSTSCCTGSILESAVDESDGKGGLGGTGGHGETEPICRQHGWLADHPQRQGLVPGYRPG